MNKRTADGMCQGCGNKKEELYSLCADCRSKRRQQYRKSIKLGICGYCHKKPIVNRSSCSECRTRNAAKNQNKPYMKRQKKLRNESKKERESKGLCIQCGINKRCKLSKECESCRNYRISIGRELKLLVVKEYGGLCVCCNENNPMFLTIDHINNDGKEEMTENGNNRVAGWALYKRLKGLGYPKDRYQLLCYNCNIGKYRNNGICPHKSTAMPH